MKTFEELWEEIEEQFDFEKVKETMDALNWKWVSCDGVPNTAQIIKGARYVCEQAYKRKSERYGTGGFYAEYKDGGLILYFAIDICDVW